MMRALSSGPWHNAMASATSASMLILSEVGAAIVGERRLARAGMTLAPIANSTTTQQLRWLAQIKSPLLFTDLHRQRQFSLVATRTPLAGLAPQCR
jgi:hypothetical protein